MNKKKLNTFLIPLTVVLWILIVVRIVSYTRPHQPDMVTITHGNTGEKASAKNDTIDLLLNYPDPFSRESGFISKTAGVVREPEIVTEKFFAKPEESPMPAISYNGMIKTGNNEKIVALLVVEGRSVLVAPNETVSGVKVAECWRDSVKIQVKDKSFIVRRR